MQYRSSSSNYLVLIISCEMLVNLMEQFSNMSWHHLDISLRDVVFVVGILLMWLPGLEYVWSKSQTRLVKPCQLIHFLLLKPSGICWVRHLTSNFPTGAAQQSTVVRCGCDAQLPGVSELMSVAVCSANTPQMNKVKGHVALVVV